MIIKEQSYQDLLKDGWVSTSPKDYKPEIYKTKWSSGVRLYKRKDGKPIDQSQVGIQTYEGTYTTNIPIIKKIRVYKDKDENEEDALYLSSVYLEDIPKLKNYTNAKLTPNKNNPLVFTISNKSGEELIDAITFSSNSFVLKLGRFLTINATKVSGGTTDPVTTPPPDEKKKPTPAEKEKKEIPVVRTNTLHFNNDKKTYVATKVCDDFPFSLGCSNKLIGDLNASLFNGDRRNDVYNDGLQNLLDNSGSFGVNSNMEITKEIYDDVMNRLRKNNIIKETVKKVLKEYIINK
jgi:hypothetical protein